MARASVAIISRWHHLIENFNTSSLDFYSAVEAALRARELPEFSVSRIEFKEAGVASAKREYLRVSRERLAFDICAAPYGRGFFFSWWMGRLGPAHPWLWLLGCVLVFLFWAMWLGGAFTQTLFSMGGGGAGCIFYLLLLGFPAGLAALGWGIREGYVSIEEEDVLAIPVIGWLYERLFQPLTYYRFDTALMFQESVRRAVNEVIENLLSARGLRALTEEQKRPTIRDLAR